MSGTPVKPWQDDILTGLGPACMQGPKEIGDIDTDDEKDEEGEYEQWKSRELGRIR